jgi:hypothetical protein
MKAAHSWAAFFGARPMGGLSLYLIPLQSKMPLNLAQPHIMLLANLVRGICPVTLAASLSSSIRNPRLMGTRRWQFGQRDRRT